MISDNKGKIYRQYCSDNDEILLLIPHGSYYIWCVYNNVYTVLEYNNDHETIF
jgi:hypothetical protein